MSQSVGCDVADRRSSRRACPRFLLRLLSRRHHLANFHFTVIDRLVEIQDDAIVALDHELVAALDLLAGQGAAFLLDTLEASAGRVRSDQPARNGAAQAAHFHERELFLTGIVTHQAHAFEALAGLGTFAEGGFLIDAASRDSLAVY